MDDPQAVGNDEAFEVGERRKNACAFGNSSSES